MRKTILAFVAGFSLLVATLPLLSLAFRDGAGADAGQPRSIALATVTTVRPSNTDLEMAVRPCEGREAGDVGQS